MTAFTFALRSVEMRGRHQEAPNRGRAYLPRRIERLEKRLERADNRLAYMRRSLKRAEGMLRFGITAAPHANRQPFGLIGHVLDALANAPMGSAIQFRAEKKGHVQTGLHGQAKLRGWKVAVRTVGETVLVVRIQ